MCRYVSSLSAKANQQINEQKYYPALITLDELEKSIRNVHRFEFAQFLERHIPKFKTKIRQCVERDFNDWLVEAKTKSEKIGNLMLEWNEQQEREPNPLRLNQQYQQYVIDPKTKKTASVFEIVELKFAPVYTCKHIFETMYMYEQFKGVNYKRNREIQLRHELDHFPSPSLSSHGDLSSLRNWLEKLLGFFAVENAILHSTSSLLSNVEINSLWERSRLEILTVISMYFNKERSYKVFLEIKQLVANFCFTVARQLNLDVAPIIEILVTQREEFYKILTNDAQERCGIQIYKLETYEPYDVTKAYQTHYLPDDTAPTSGSLSPQTVNVQERISELEQFDLSDTQMHLQKKNKNEKVLPFSWTLIVCARSTYRFVNEYLAYREHIISPSSYCDELKSGIVELLTFANVCMGTVFESSKPQLQGEEDILKEWSQWVVNLQYMYDRIVPYFDRLYRTRVIHEQVPENDKSVVYLTALKNQVHATLQRGETAILKVITNKCTTILEKSKANNWAPVPVNTGVNDKKITSPTEAHDFMIELVSYLKRVDEKVKYISYDTRENTIFFQTFQFIAQYLTDLATSTRIEEGLPRGLNMISVRHLQIDLRYLMDNLIKQVPVMSKGQHSFASLIGLIDFLLAEGVREMALVDEKAIKLLQDAVNDDNIDLEQLGLSSINQKAVQDLLNTFCTQNNIANVNSDRVKHLQAILHKIGLHQVEILKETAANARASRKKSKKKNFLFGLTKK
jgi:hypothetical protein